MAGVRCQEERLSPCFFAPFLSSQKRLLNFLFSKPARSDLRSDRTNLAIDHGGSDQKLDQILDPLAALQNSVVMVDANGTVMVSRLSNGQPAQFLLSSLNNRCSIGFHFDVPVG